MFTFQPMTEEEINSVNLIEEGTYDFEVIKSMRKISKSNNPMAELKLSIWDHEGKQHLIFDYLVFSTVPLNIRKVKHFCDTTGLSENYQQGQLPEELARLSGKVHIGIQEGQPKPEGGYYPQKNYVIDYIMKDKETEEISLKKDTEIDDSIPF